MNSSQINLAMSSSAPGEVGSLVPDVNSNYVAWGHYEDIQKFIQSQEFNTIYVTGLSGNGKTTMIEQACAKSGRELVRANITAETDEDDLLGGFRLYNGSTVFVYGPVIEAMRRGAVLLLDEVDLASDRIMCLQPVLEGKGIFLKKVSEFVKPAPGFMVIATANTKGDGNGDDRFVGTRIQNEAFLDRFGFTYEQEYAPRTVETRILIRQMVDRKCRDDDFANYLTRWAETIRKGFAEGALDKIVSTRRLVDIVRGFSIFNDKEKAIRLALARFDSDTQNAFWNLYTKIDPTINPVPEVVQPPETPAPAAPPQQTTAAVVSTI
jgi:MoxR-like ATPase